jgi:hypothetical protein
MKVNEIMGKGKEDGGEEKINVRRKVPTMGRQR